MKGSQEERFEAALKQAVEHLQSQRQVSTEQRAASWERLASEAQRAMRRSQRPRLHWGAWAAAAAAIFVIVGFWLGRASVDSRGSAVTRAPAVNKLRPEPASKERSATAKSEPPTRIEETVPRKTVNTGRRLASGARLETSHDAVFSIERDEAVRGVISLDAGRVSLEVPKLEAGATLAVRTKGARVVVHGTRFSVARSAGNTEITVSEGVVEVISLQTRETSTFLSAGESMRLEDGTLRLARLENALERSLADLDYSTYAEIAGEYLKLAPPSESSDTILLRRANALARVGTKAQAIRLLSQNWEQLTTPLARENALAQRALLEERPLATWVLLLREFPVGLHRRAAIETVTSSPCNEARSLDEEWIEALGTLSDPDLDQWIEVCTLR